MNRHEQEKLEADLELLNLRLATAEAECEKIQQELLANELLQNQTSLNQASQPYSSKQWTASKRSGRGVHVATASVFAVLILSIFTVYHDALSNVLVSNVIVSNVTDSSQYEESAMRELANGPIVRNEYQSTDGKLSSNRTTSIKIYRSRKATSQQWGPSLLLQETSSKQQASAFDPVVKEQQKNLLTLGFDVGKADGFKGARTRQAIEEFRALYLQGSGKQIKDADLASLMANYANLARSDAARFGIDHGIVAAIRLSSIRTGVDFSYLMKLAAAESNFKPESKAATSSATGMYQFTRDTWLNTLKAHGAKYGLVGDYAANIEHYETRYGYQRPKVRDKKVYKHLLELRKNPRVSAIMAAEMVRDSEQLLTHSLDRKPTQTDLYLTHFLGNDDAISFLRSLGHSPDKVALELFPEAASSNRDIFHTRSNAPRTVDQVYALFGEKFSTRRFDEISTN